MIAVLKSELPIYLHRDFVCFRKRFRTQRMLKEKVFDRMIEDKNLSTNIIEANLNFVREEVLLEEFHKDGFKGINYRKTLQETKKMTYKTVFELLMSDDVEDMAFHKEAWIGKGTPRTAKDEKGSPVRIHPDNFNSVKIFFNIHLKSKTVN